ncbi:MAG: class I SAM-dependent methyltransferase [Anaerolineae bacterium]|nr:class I SAM-dependent methyltransferase [Anaerolineae bacterium]
MPETVSFDRAAEFYDETRGFPAGEEGKIAEVIAQTGNLHSASRVLEVGVGTGRIALPLAERVRLLAGVDISSAMLRRLRSKPGSAHVVTAQASADALPLPAGQFDCAVAVHVFHLIPTWKQVIAELARTLRPGARLVHCWSRQDAVTRQLWDVWRATIPDDHVMNVGVAWEDNETFLPAMGWEAITEVVEHRYAHDLAPAVFLDRLRRRVWSQTWRLSDAQIERGAATLEAFIKATYADPDAPMRVTSGFLAQAYMRPG